MRAIVEVEANITAEGAPKSRSMQPLKEQNSHGRELNLEGAQWAGVQLAAIAVAVNSSIAPSLAARCDVPLRAGKYLSGRIGETPVPWENDERL